MLVSKLSTEDMVSFGAVYSDYGAVQQTAPLKWRDLRDDADASSAVKLSCEVRCAIFLHIPWSHLAAQPRTFMFTMPATKILKKMAAKFSAITTLTKAFCALYLDDEYRQLIDHLVGALARKRPSPLLSGKDNVWAAASVHAIGRVNHLDDPSQAPHCKPKVIYAFFGIAESTGQSKSRQIRDLLKMNSFSPEWTLPSRLAKDPRVWLLMVNGMVLDVRGASVQLQRQAFEKGLIPFVPADQPGVPT